jgi:hypothetical protein
MPNQSSFLRISGAQPFSAFMNKIGGSSKRKRNMTKKVIRRKTVKKINRVTPTLSDKKRKPVKRKKNKSIRRKSNRKSNRKPSRTLTKPSYKKHSRSKTLTKPSYKKPSRTRTLTLPSSSFSSKKDLTCKCDKNMKIKGTEPSPRGLGHCAHCTPLNVTMKGNDGNLWENRKYTKDADGPRWQGRRWVKIIQSGGYLRAGTF